jgi:DNA polymerase II large subunit
MDDYKCLCVCGKKEEFIYQFGRCKGCKLTRYCSEKCFYDDKNHILICKRVKNNNKTNNFLQYINSNINNGSIITLLDKLLIESFEYFVKNSFLNFEMQQNIVLCKIGLNYNFDYELLDIEKINNYCKNLIYKEIFEKTKKYLLILINDEQSKVTLFFISDLLN